MSASVIKLFWLLLVSHSVVSVISIDCKQYSQEWLNQEFDRLKSLQEVQSTWKSFQGGLYWNIDKFFTNHTLNLDNDQKPYQTEQGTIPNYPIAYMAKKGEKCQSQPSKVHLLKGFEKMVNASEIEMMQVVAKRPISIAIRTTKAFNSVHDGVIDFDDKECPRNGTLELDHAIVLVGYGSDEKNGNYWIVKNSWSESWGDKGYGKMRRDAEHCGACGICVQPSWPTVTTEP